jgi:hypothetical protein
MWNKGAETGMPFALCAHSMHPKINLAEAHQDKTPTTQLKITTNVKALRTKIQTFSRKQEFSIQRHIKADLDVWNSTMGMC